MSRNLFKSLILLVFFFFFNFYVYAEQLRVGYGALGGTYLPLWVTDAVGLYKKYGLDVELVYIAGDSRITSAMLAGQTPIAGPGTSIVAAAVRGGDAVIIATMVNTLPHYMMARPEIKTKQDLKGKRVAISTFGSASDLVTRMALEGLGLVPDRDVAIIQIGAIPQRFAAMEANVVQATVLTPPTNLLAEKMGFSTIVNVAALGLKIPNSVVGTTRSFLKSHRDTARKFLMAYIEGIKVMKSDSDLSIKTLSKYSRVTDFVSLNEAYKVYAETVPSRPYIDLPSIQKVIDFYSRGGIQQRMLKPDDVVDMSLLQEIDRSGFIDSLYKK